MEELFLNLKDEEWPLTIIDHDRTIARAIVIDDERNFYFVRVNRDDDFGKAFYIETSGGGVEDMESIDTAIQRELEEEMGVSVDILAKIGVVSDYYNQIHRHNINHYFLCKITKFGNNHLTEDERNKYHLFRVCFKYEDAVKEYENGRKTKIGRLVYNREMPILKRAYEIILEGDF